MIQYILAWVAQLGERSAEDGEVPGSIPGPSTKSEILGLSPGTGEGRRTGVLRIGRNG